MKNRARLSFSALAVTVLSLIVLSLSPRASVATSLQPPSSPVYGVKVEKVWIPMRDGVRLAATLFMPTGNTAGKKFPALLEYLPYRKDDETLDGDYRLHTYFVHRGYVTARVDIRGTGASEGATPKREYSEREQLDGEQVIAWLASRQWSNGKIGMFGISWGGFNSIQMAMRRPPHLAAIIAVCATEELYEEDVHFIDGMMHVDEFEIQMDLDQSMSRSPDFPLDDKTLAARFDNPPWSLLYMQHQRNGAFWHEPVRSLDAIRIPVFLIGGMLDGYRDSIPRMLAQLRAPMKAIIGPWNHTYPDSALPGPAIEWQREALRWWDYWLKGRDTGIMREPQVSVYMQHWHPPEVNVAAIPGEWRYETRWPPPESRVRTMYLNDQKGLGDSIPPAGVSTLRYLPSAGVEMGFWWGDLTVDQRPSDAYSLVYDSAPLAQPVAILGRPDVLMHVSATAPLADWFARLCDVAPDGTVVQVTGAGINGAQRISASGPSNLQIGRVYSVNVSLHLTSWVFPKGHRVRLAVSNSWWPTIWSTPYLMNTSLYEGGNDASRLTLPIVPENSTERPTFLPPQPSDHLAGVRSEGGTWPGQYFVTRDESRQATQVEWRGWDASQFPWGSRLHHERLTYEVMDEHPEVNIVRGDADTTWRVGKRRLVYEGHLEMRSDRTTFYYSYDRRLSENGRLVREKWWHERIPRDYQ